MKTKLPDPESNYQDYFITHEYPDKIVAYVIINEAFLANKYSVEESLAPYGIACENTWVDWSIIFEFDSEEEMINYVNTFPNDIGFAVGYIKGVMVTNN